MVTLFQQLNLLLNSSDRKRLVFLACALVLRAGVEMVGVASIMPFIGVVANPEIIYQNDYLRLFYSLFEFDSSRHFVIALGCVVIIFLVLANGISALTVYATTRFSWGVHHRLSIRLLEGYLRQPFAFFVQHNSAEFNKILLNECQQVIQNLLLPLLNAIAKSLVITAIAIMLFIMEPTLALSVVLVVGGVYAVLFAALKKKQRQLGKDRVKANEERFKITGEVFGGIKDVKVLQREYSFVTKFRSASRRFSLATASNATIAALPRYLFETIAFGGIVTVVIYYLGVGNGVEEILPLLSLYAFAGYRLMPEVQQLFAAVAQIRFNRAALDALVVNFDKVEASAAVIQSENPLTFENDIVFDNVSFTYPNSTRQALDRVSLRIKRNQIVGLIGASGSGKTTLVDLLLGLYRPDKGDILIDGVKLTEDNIAAWRLRVGYVPQHIFLTDDSVQANIAFGVDPKEVDGDRVERAARIANIHDFISNLPMGYYTIVGERGVRMSGGQRQRIGIARALYHDPEVLIMDEATSALDGATENAIMEAIHALAGQKTIILIAHRLTTVEQADTILIIRDGRIEQSGTFRELLQESQYLREIANLSSSELASGNSLM